jgi:hypothetical protein
MTVIARVTGAVVLWLIALVAADLQMPAGEDGREDVTVEAAVDVPAAGPAGTRDMTVTNERSRAVVLAPAAATLGDATAGCPASLVTRAAPLDAVEVPPGATVVVPVEVRVDTDAPATCRAESWPVELSATAPATGEAAAPADDGPGLLPYAIATTGVLALVGLTMLAAAAVHHRRHPVPAAGDETTGPAPRAPVAAGAGRTNSSSRGHPAPRA